MKILLLVCTAILACTVVVHGQDYVLSIAPVSGVNNGEVSDGTSFQLSANLDNNAGDIQGWSYGVCHDTALLSLDDVVEGSTTATANGGAPADFAQLNTENGGYTLGVVISFVGAAVLPQGLGYELTVATYTSMAGVSPGDEPVPTTVTPCETLGSPPVTTVVVVGGASLPPDQIPLDLLLSPIPPPRDFVRGDANADGLVNIADGIWMLSNLFQGGPGIDCDLANDANDDGTFDTADAVFDLSYVFLGGSPPPAPFPACGQIAGQTIEQCQDFSGCP